MQQSEEAWLQLAMPCCLLCTFSSELGTKCVFATRLPRIITMPFSPSSLLLRGTLPKASKVFLADLTKAYLVQTSFLVQIESFGGLDPAKRIQAGGIFDLLLLALSKRALAATGDVDIRRCQ